MDIFADETLEDLQCANLKLIQKKHGFRFGVDAVLLADFAKSVTSNKTLDLCTGSGIVPILLTAKTNTKEFFGLEIQEEVFAMANRSIMINGLEDKIKLTLGDVKNSVAIYGKRQFDLITCNPPYMPVGCGIKNPTDTKIIARHEVLCTLNDVILSASDMLKVGGHLTMVHKPSRLADILCAMRNAKIEPKRIRFVHKTIGSEPSLVLVDGSFNGGKELRIMPPLFLYNDDGNETKELQEVYNR